jgi:Ca2+/Na+ antiporter
MKSRIYLLSFFLFFAFVMLTATSVKADNDAPDNYYNHYNAGNNSTSLAVNYRVAFVEVAVVIIGVIVIRNARVAINAKLGSAADESI